MSAIGDCTCPGWDGAPIDKACPLHSDESSHPEPVNALEDGADTGPRPVSYDPPAEKLRMKLCPAIEPLTGHLCSGEGACGAGWHDCGVCWGRVWRTAPHPRPTHDMAGREVEP